MPHEICPHEIISADSGDPRGNSLWIIAVQIWTQREGRSCFNVPLQYNSIRPASLSSNSPLSLLPPLFFVDGRLQNSTYILSVSVRSFSFYCALIITTIAAHCFIISFDLRPTSSTSRLSKTEYRPFPSSFETKHCHGERHDRHKRLRPSSLGFE